jgi:2OG-Fe(II) oxygenase superfamily
MPLQWLASASGYETACKAKENYPDGFVAYDGGAPALLYGQPKYVFGLDEVATNCRTAYATGAMSDSTVYAKLGGADKALTVDKTNRSSRDLLVTRDQVSGALTTLEMTAMDFFRQASCSSFRLSDREYTVLSRQFLAYGAGDHFAGHTGVRGHADDSLFTIDKWVRNDSLRHIVGIIWPNGQDEATTDDSLSTFSGGEIVFPFITEDGTTPLTIAPQANDIVVFPANPMYLHYVRKVGKGLRISLTTWWTLATYRPAPGP